MCKKLCSLLCLVSFLILCNNARAQLLAHYQLDETSGNIAVDSSIKGNDGIIEKITEDGEGGDPNWVPDGINGCLGFDGNMDVNLPAESMGLRSDSGTVAFWMKLAEVAGGINIIWWGGDSTTGNSMGPENEMHIHVEAAGGDIWVGGELCFRVLHGDPNMIHLHSDPEKSDAGDPGASYVNPTLVNDNDWHHVVGTWGDADGNVNLYLNGTLLQQATYLTPSYPLSYMYLGQSATGARPYTGLLDDVQIYGRALTEQEIQNVMSAGAALTLPASMPLPTNMAVEVPRDSVLSWTAGDTAVKHNVYFGTNFDDVNQASLSDPRNVLLSENQDGLSFDPPGLLDYDQTYYWRIDEVEADGTTIQRGNIWSFRVMNFIVIDDFEDYDDANNIIYESWDDYFINNTGMVVGYLSTPSIEQTIFHSGSQSMPLTYDLDGTVNEGTNLETTGTSFYAETQLQLTDLDNWTVDNVESLSLWFVGSAAQVSSFEENTAARTYTITASGADIWGAVDECHFAYKEITTGNTTITARIDSLDNTDPFAKAGVMVRDTLEAGSRYAGLFMTPENGVRFQYRNTADGTTDRQFDPNVVIPYWVKLERTSSGLTRAYYSEDHNTWTRFDLNIASMSFPIYVGLAVTSHDAEAVSEAVFSNVTITGTGSDQAWSNEDIGIPSNAPQPIYIALNNNAVIYHEDPNASLISDWTQWNINLQEFTDLGVNLANVTSLGIGIGDRNATEPDGSGSVFIDDIRLYRPSSGN